MALSVLHISGAMSGPSLLVLAGIHGDEYEGVHTTLRLFHELSPEELRGHLMMIPAANPFAYRSKTRCSPDDGLNLARVFPGKLGGSVTERLAYELHQRFIAKSDFLLDLHSGGTQYEIAALTGYYHNEQSELGHRSREAAEAFGIPLLWGHERIAPGRSISSAHALGIPWLYTESSGGGRVRSKDAAYYYDGTLRLMHHLGMFTDSKERLIAKGPSSFQTIFGEGNFDKSAICEQEGFFIPSAALMSRLRVGDHIGSIFDLNGHLLQEVHADQTGCLVMLAGSPVVSRGDPLYLIAPYE